MNWYQVVLLLATIACIAAPMLYVFGIKEKEMRPNVKEMQNVQALRIENAKLREQIVQLQADWESERDYANQMEAKEKRAVSENVKLRELAKAFDWCTENFDLPCKCDKCPLSQSDKLTPECEVRMRELGVEADG